MYRNLLIVNQNENDAHIKLNRPPIACMLNDIVNILNTLDVTCSSNKSFANQNIIRFIYHEYTHKYTYTFLLASFGMLFLGLNHFNMILLGLEHISSTFFLSANEACVLQNNIFDLQ